MKNFLIAVSLTAILLLSACTPQSECDVNEFLKALSTCSTISLSIDDLTAVRDGKLVRYSHCSDGILLCFYADSSGVIVRCTASALKRSQKLVSDFSAVCRTFTGIDSKKCLSLLESAEKNGRSFSDGYCLAAVDNQAGCTFILSHETDELNTNGYPTLKKHIRKEDISRPTIGKDEKTSNHN